MGSKQADVLPSGLSCSSPTSDAGGDKKCAPCASLDQSSLLSPSRVQEQVSATLPLWRYHESGGGPDKCPRLSRKFTAKSFQCALDAMNAIGAIAEREGHHPDLHITSYREVEVVLFTHKLSGVTGNDLELARMLDAEVGVVYSPKWLRENPEAERKGRGNQSA